MHVLFALLACIESGISGGDKPVEDTGPTDPTIHDTDHDGTADAYDCAPTNSFIHPEAREYCDEVDNNCDGIVDGVFDLDNDGYDSLADCYRLGGTLDCDDADPAVNPEAEEVCNGRDDNCDGDIDDVDADADSYTQCEDCDDHNPFVFPGAADACDGLDNNCDGDVDELWDGDGDGFSPCGEDTTQADCNDEDAAISPNAGDICDGVDNNCDGAVDELFDADSDGVATCSGDCNDSEATVYPGADELCDGLDNDCNPTTPEDVDQDSDGFTVCTGDCDDAAAAAFPGGIESCDDVDNDCNGYTDEDPSCWSCMTEGDYEICTEDATWEEARDACESFGYSLAMIGSSGENDTIANAAQIPTWIGLTDVETEGTWLWVDGSPLGYENWASSEPTGTDDVNCAFTNNNGRRGEWADDACSSSKRFACEH